VLGLIAAALNYPVDPLLQVLDEERSAGRLEEAQYWFDSSEPTRRDPEYSERVRAQGHRQAQASQANAAFPRRPIEELLGSPALFSPDSAQVDAAMSDAPYPARNRAASGAVEPGVSSPPDSSSNTRALRYLAVGSDSSGVRLGAIEQLGDEASLALRTLRGLAADDDPAIAHKARRVLRELGVPTPAEAAEGDPAE
jgi:hypothetical protein